MTTNALAVLKCLAESTDDPRAGLVLLALVGDGFTREDALHFLGGKPERADKYLSDLVFAGVLVRESDTGRYRLGAMPWRWTARRRWPLARVGTLPSGDELAVAMAMSGTAPPGEQIGPRCEQLPPVSVRPAPDAGSGSNRAEANLAYSRKTFPNPIRVESSRALKEEDGYLAEKLALPALAGLRAEVLGGNPAMRQKWERCRKECPDALREWVGAAASGEIASPIRFLNAKMTEALGGKRL